MKHIITHVLSFKTIHSSAGILSLDVIAPLLTPFAWAQNLKSVVHSKIRSSEITASFHLYVVPASQAFLSSPTICCLWYQLPSVFAAECRRDSPDMLFVPTLHRPFTSAHQSHKTSISSKLHHSSKNMWISSSSLLLLHPNLFNSNRLWGKTFPWRKSARSCSYVAKSLTHFYVYSLIKIHLFSPTRHKTLPKASRANAKSKEAF